MQNTLGETRISRSKKKKKKTAQHEDGGTADVAVCPRSVPRMHRRVRGRCTADGGMPQVSTRHFVADAQEGKGKGALYRGWCRRWG
eukprot:1503751-Rhodomonas_salina.2